MLKKREEIRVLLAKHCLSYVWLVNQLNKLGYDLTSAEMCLYVTGRRRGDRAEAVLSASLEILDRYVRDFAEKEKSPE